MPTGSCGTTPTGYFRRSFEIAERIGDIHLQGLGLLNHAEVHLARQRYDQARQNAETALGIFDQLGSKLDKADAYKVIGRVYRETGRHALAESRLRSAIELAVSTGLDPERGRSSTASWRCCTRAWAGTRRRCGC